jgi:hypothetical protein
MSDWNEQGAPNNNNPSVIVRNSKQVGNEGLKAGVNTNRDASELTNEDTSREELQSHLLSRQPGMGK